MEIQTGGGVFHLGNPDGRGGLAVLEIQTEGGVKNLCHPSGGGVDFFRNNPFHFSSKIMEDKSPALLAFAVQIVSHQRKSLLMIFSLP